MEDYEPSIFYRRTANSFSVCAIYVDDIILGARHEEDVKEFERVLESNFKITKGQLDEVLGIKIVETESHIELSQTQYIVDKATMFELRDSKEVSTPIIKGFSGKGSNTFIGDKYLKIIGALGYAAKTTRADIQYAFSYLSRFCQGPTIAHWNCARRALSYLFHTKNLSLQYSKQKMEAQEMILARFTFLHFVRRYPRGRRGPALFNNA